MPLLAPLLACIAFLSPIAMAQDAGGAKDHPMFSRMPGYAISNADVHDFSAFEFQLEPPKSLEGRYWHIEYAIGEGGKRASPLQISRNYTNLVERQGGKKLREEVSSGGGLAVAELKTGGRNLLMQIDINNSGEMYVLTVVEEAAMEQQVEFTASELATALKGTGRVALRNILFDTGKATLQPRSEAALAPVGELLKSDPALKLEIQGHTDNAGAPAANLKLSQERAAAVRAHLVQKLGVAAARLTSAGFGDTRPVADNGSEAGRAANRRVELVRK